MEVEGSCWEWPKAKTHDGYGRAAGGKMAHRVIYELMVYKLPKELTLDHLCRNRACVNPAHLEPVLNRTNILRGEAPPAINSRKTHCIHGHPLSGNNLSYTKEGKRRCRECSRYKTRKARAKRLHEHPEEAL